MQSKFQKNPLAIIGLAAVVVGVLIFLINYFVFFSNPEMLQNASGDTLRLYQTLNWCGAAVYWVGVILSFIAVFRQPKLLAFIALGVSLCNEVWNLFNSGKTLINVPTENLPGQVWFFLLLDVLLFGSIVFVLVRELSLNKKMVATTNSVEPTTEQTAKKKRNICGILGFAFAALAFIVLVVLINYDSKPRMSQQEYATNMFLAGAGIRSAQAAIYGDTVSAVNNTIALMVAEAIFLLSALVLSIIGLFKTPKGFAAVGLIVIAVTVFTFLSHVGEI